MCAERLAQHKLNIKIIWIDWGFSDAGIISPKAIYHVMSREIQVHIVDNSSLYDCYDKVTVLSLQFSNGLEFFREKYKKSDRRSGTKPDPKTQKT